jgi:hypothetical protein
MLGILYEEMHGVLREGIATAYHRVGLLDIEGHLTIVLEFPGIFVCRGVIFDVLDIPSSLQYQGL